MLLSVDSHNTFCSATVSYQSGSLQEADASQKGVIEEIYRGTDRGKGSVRNDEVPWDSWQR